ncbi:hypothetical protein H0H87_002855 [Tephrocybe sp. NHM501043]|nr:hypothetical protein H0H87_002855 [Tephrocybe sp. NHM501043]
MTEYDFSPEAYERYLRGQDKIATWVNRTNQVPKADPYQAATPAVDVPRELLPLDRTWDSNAPWLKLQEGKKKTRKKRTPSEKEFDRERRNDYKYSHREHMDALRAAAVRPESHRSQTAPAPQTSRRRSYDGRAAPPPPLQTRSLHPGAVYPVDHRFSDSQDTTSSSKAAGFSHPQTNQQHKRSASVQPPTRSTPTKGPTPYYLYGAEINAQIDTSPPPAQRQKHMRSQTTPLPPPPASAPVYPSPQYQQQHFNGSHTFPRQQQPPSRSSTHPYQYTPSPLSPPDSAPAYSGAYPRPPVAGIPNQSSLQAPKMNDERPFLQRVLMHLPGLRTRARSPSSSTRSRSQPPSQVQPPSHGRPQTPTSPTKSSWLGSPTKNKLTKPGRSRTSLDQWAFVPTAEAIRLTDDKAWSRPSLDGGMERGTAREREQERGQEKSSVRDVERGYDGERRKGEKKDREKSQRHNGSRERERELEREVNNREKPYHSRRKRSFDRDRERGHERTRQWGTDRDFERYEWEKDSRSSRPKEKTRERDKHRDGREKRREVKDAGVYARRGSA